MVRSFHILVLCALAAGACTSSVRRTEEKSARESAPTLAQAIDAVAENIAQDFPDKGKIRVALLPLLTEVAEETRLGKYIAEALTTRLQRSKKCTVIERSHIERVFRELQFQTSELTDPATAARLGVLLGADAVCSGTLTDLGDVVELNVRSIVVESAAVMTTAHAAFAKTAHVASMLTPLPSTPQAAATASTPSPVHTDEPLSSGCVPPGIPLDHPGVGIVRNRMQVYTLRIELEGCGTFLVPPGAESSPLYIPLNTARQLTVQPILAATGEVVGKTYYETLHINPSLGRTSDGWGWDRGFGDNSFR